ncbi:MAG: glycoside hydrolase family 3 C-terminal domain-containing protein [Clostridia bacterium]|nr:glycoside hydrolase family 3 C-terminal domain-containing protein [Clostridia bacterium]
MKRIISLFAALALVLSLVPAAFAEDGYIPAPYDPAQVDPTVTYMEPVFYENENGPTIGVTTVGVIVKDGLYFKDLNNNKELDPCEDWRLDAKTRAADLVSKMSLEDQAGFVFNALAITPNAPKLAMVKNEDGTINPAAVVTILGEGEESRNAFASGFAGLDSFVINTQKVRAGVYRGGLNFDASTVALYNNVVTEMAEADAAVRGVPAIPMTIISNPIPAGFPDAPGMAAAVMGDGNYDAIREYAEVDRQMWVAQGINAMYGPQVDLVTDPRWPRNLETFCERPEVTAGIITALVDGYHMGTDGLKPGAVALSVKHFPGDGSSENGFESHTAQGQWRLYPTPGSLEKYQLVAFQAAIDAKCGSIMPSYSRDAADDRSAPQSYRGYEVKPQQLGSAYNKEIITTLLRDVMGFDGYVNTDSGIVTGQTFGVEDLSLTERYALLISAGSDAIGSGLRTDLVIEAVETGILAKEDLDRANINRAVSIFEQGRFDNPYLDYNKADEIRATNLETAFAQAYALNQKAVVLMKNHENALPLAADAGTKLYIASFTGAGEDDDMLAALTELFTAKGFEVVDKAKDAEVAYFYVQPKGTTSTNGTDAEGILELVEDFEVDEREMSGGSGGFGQGVVASQKKTGEKIEKTTLADVDKLAKAANTVHENGGKVIATIVCTSPWILTNLEPYCDALLAQYTTSGASLNNARNAQIDVITGAYNPTGKLAVTMVSSQDVIALTYVENEDGTYLETCASPNDVPGYDKDQYIDPAILANVKGGSYAYQDADGNYYVSGFGLSY